MTFDLYHIGDRIRLPHARQARALARLRAAIDTEKVGKERASTIAVYLNEHGKTLTDLTFDELIMLWGWNTVFEEKTEDLVSLYPEEESSSDEDLLFECLAPDMEDHSYVELENGKSRYRKYFFQGKVIEQDGAYTYPQIENFPQANQTAEKEWRSASEWIAATIFDHPSVEGLNEFDAEDLGQRILEEILNRFLPSSARKEHTPITDFLFSRRVNIKEYYRIPAKNVAEGRQKVEEGLNTLCDGLSMFQDETFPPERVVGLDGNEQVELVETLPPE